MTVRAIDIHTGNRIFEGADPIGLQVEASVGRYLQAFREKVRELYPKAQVYIRWNPRRGDPADVFTVPAEPQAQARLSAMAEELRGDKSWILYDEGVRAAFGG